ncbi:histidine kinase (plasmid) [Neorhizobium sp. SOG26]|uniref:ATP-binding protein n=1 Tax=Neorhizobium sp. SOG26 TaxID=2060726 RepID=UPI000E57588A|nr:ATP-binding protein [Neorhizobium sp. SOG26]AXV18097.1 histidine kinase [Neorhizobium sp. SOG26]
MTATRTSVRTRLLLTLIALSLATLVVGGTSWTALSLANSKLDHLHDVTLASAERALALSRRASDLATKAPYLLTLPSPFRIRQQADEASRTVNEILGGVSPDDAEMVANLRKLSENVNRLADVASERARLTDRILRINAEIAILERRYSDNARQTDRSLAEAHQWLELQRMAGALIGAGRAGNLVAVGEYQREFRVMIARLGSRASGEAWDLRTRAEGSDGLFELRRQELARQIEAEAALDRIRLGAEATNLYAAQTGARAQADIAAERDRARSSLTLAKSIILIAVLASAVVAITAGIFVSTYVAANLRAISEAMSRLAVGDRSSRLPRTTHPGDEIGKLFQSFRAFRANALRLDRSNRQLAQRNALFQNLYDGMSDGLAILSETGALVARNSRFAQVSGVATEALVGRPVMADLLAEAGWTRVDGADGFAELHHPSGRVLELRESRLATGGSVMLFSDASKRRELEDRLRSVQRTEALGKISGEVAHDFGNILSTISTSLHLMETASPERMSGLRQSIGSALEVGTSLTQRLLAFARRLNLEPEVVDLNTLLQGVEDLIGFALSEEIEFEIKVTDKPLMVRVDPGQMESALLNLCLNAGQAISGAGRVEIRLSLKSHEIAQIEVSDTGRGMSPEVLAQATEPFFTTRADGTGTGLGLAMVYGFIRQSGGDLEMTSTVGNGTTVRLLLPLASAEHRKFIVPGPVLLVEDNPVDAAHARRLLETPKLIEACSVAEALDILASRDPFELVVTDFNLLGEAAGWRIAETALTRSAETKVIVVSGNLPDSSPLAGRFAGRIFCLTKPLTSAALAACLNESLPA